MSEELDQDNAGRRLNVMAKRRTRVIRRFPAEMSVLSLNWSVMNEDSKTWHGMIMDAAHQSLALAAVESLRKGPIIVKGFKELLAA